MAWLRRLSLVTVVTILVTGTVSKDTREDGKCGPGNPAPSGRAATCEHM